ncbi:MAG: hypothetical protein U0136_06465 [Bdellovibrionota bacterium]
MNFHNSSRDLGSVETVAFGAGVLVRALPAQLLHEAGKHRSLVLCQRRHDWRVDAWDQYRGYNVDIYPRDGGPAERHWNESVAAWLAMDRQWSDLLELAASPTLQTVISNTGEDTFHLRKEWLKPPVGLETEHPNPEFFLGQLLVFLLHRYKSGAGPIFVQPAELLIENAGLLRASLLTLADTWLSRSRDHHGFLEYLRNEVKFRRTLVDRLTPEANITPRDGNSLDLVTEKYCLYAVERHGDEPAWCDHDRAIMTTDPRPYARRKIVLVNAWRSLLVQHALHHGVDTNLPFSVLMNRKGLDGFREHLLYGELLPTVVDDTPRSRRFAWRAAERFKVEPVASRIIKVMGGDRLGHQRKLIARSRQLLDLFNTKFKGIPPLTAEILSTAGLNAEALLEQERRDRATLTEQIAAVA